MSTVDRIVLGSGSLGTTSDAAGVLSRFVAEGGQALDLANVYGNGASSRAVGRWLARSGAGTSA